MANCEANILTDIDLDLSYPDSNEVVIFTKTNGLSVIRKFGTFKSNTIPDIEFVVGEPNSPSDGDAYIVKTELINSRIRLIRGGIKQFPRDIGTGQYYTFNSTQGKVFFYPNLSKDEFISIETY